jgi:fructose-bisphosphate aldolase class 1
LGGRGRRISEFEASVVYRVSSRTARAIQRNPLSKNQNKQTNKNKTNKQKTKKGKKNSIST